MIPITSDPGTEDGSVHADLFLTNPLGTRGEDATVIDKPANLIDYPHLPAVPP